MCGKTRAENRILRKNLPVSRLVASRDRTPIRRLVREDLPVRETPASVDVITQQTMQDQVYRTNVDAAAGAVGVLAINPGGAVRLGDVVVSATY